MTTLEFLGAAGTVTGSKYFLEAGETSLLVDCGLFQGLKELRLRNWDRLPLDPKALSAVILTHAHIDHTGYLPRLVRDGFRGPVYGTAATAELVSLMLPDSGHLQEEEADYHNRKGTSKHKPARPLYTEEDGRRAARRVRNVAYRQPIAVGPGVTATFHRAGHILGSSHVTLRVENRGEMRTILFSGDLGPYDSPLLPDPVGTGEVDYLLVESTYGDRVRDSTPPLEQLEAIVLEVVRSDGALVVPAFAVGRTQILLHYLAVLESSGRIPKLPVFVDSPTAIDVTEIYCRFPDEFDEEIRSQFRDGTCPLHTEKTQFTRTPQESKAINRIRGPVVIISASGMATGGRILHHLRNRLPNPRNTILLVGYQAVGTRGRRLLEGEKTIRIFGEAVAVEARVENLHGLSAHADREGLLKWLRTAPRPPRQVFLVHGDPDALQALAAHIRQELGWEAKIPTHGERITLT